MAGPVPRGGGLFAAYLSVTPSVVSLYEGTSVTFVVNTFAVPNNTTAYYTITQVSGTVGTSTFTSASLSGSFNLYNNTGSFTLTTSAEDGNNTDDIFTVSIRETSVSGAVKLTSAEIKIVDLTTYNSAQATFDNGFGGLSLTYAIGAAGVKTTATFQGTTITANPGAAGLLGGYAAGGTYSGGDGGYNGGAGGIGASWVGAGGTGSSLTYAGGGGGVGGSAGGQPNGGWIGTSSTGTFDFNTSGLYTYLLSAGYLASQFAGPAGSVGGSGGTTQLQGSPGKYLDGGAGGGSFTKSLAANVIAYSVTNGGAGSWGGGGGGGGVSTKTGGLGGYTYATQAGGAGGTGAIAVKYDSTTTTAIVTTGVSRTIPAGVKSVKVWAIGGGGAGKASTVTTNTGVYAGQNGGGGGAGGLVYKTWTYSGSAPVKPSL